MSKYVYKDEASFSRAFCAALRKGGWMVQRIESGTTGRGIPDIYAISPSRTAVWIELKRVHHDIGHTETIPWRPGQQAWLHNVTKRGQLARTLVCFNDMLVLIHHHKIYEKNIIDTGDIANVKFIYGGIKELVRQ